MDYPKDRVWALTGSIASGKSSVEAILKDLGARIVDADAISKTLTSGGHPFLQVLKKRFGADILNDSGMALDRDKCRKRIVEDPRFKKQLESLLHPEIGKISQEMISRLIQTTKDPIFYSAAVLLEAGRGGEFPNLLLVTSHEDLRLKRLMQRDGMTSENATHLMDLQMSQEKKRGYATYEIKNNGTLEELKHAVKHFYLKNFSH